MSRYEAVVIGASAGGIHATGQILARLPADFAYPLMIVQHILPSSEFMWPEIVNKRVALHVKEAADGEPVQSGVAYIAPANYHLLVEVDKTLSLSIDPPVHWARPSIDVLFKSAADAYGKGLIGVVLTGANHDGSRGLACIKSQHGLTIVQNPLDAEVADMPKAALEVTTPDHVLDLQQIGEFLAAL